MQELRFVAVSEDGSYAVLAVPGRSGRFILPIDERLRAVALGQTSRLAQYEIEVESPLRPKEIQARIRAGETAEEIADAAGIPVERVRWFEGPVLAERAYIADQAQVASVRRAGDSAGPGPRLGDIVTERLSASGTDPEDGQWDSRKRGDGNWQVTLTFPSGGRLHVAEWVFDPRRRHIMPDDDNAARLSLPESELPQVPVPVPGEATVTPLAPRLGAAAGMGGAAGGFASGGAGVGVRSFRPERSVIPDRSLSADRSLADRSLADRSLTVEIPAIAGRSGTPEREAMPHAQATPAPAPATAPAPAPAQAQAPVTGPVPAPAPVSAPARTELTDRPGHEGAEPGQSAPPRPVVFEDPEPVLFDEQPATAATPVTPGLSVMPETPVTPDMPVTPETLGTIEEPATATTRPATSTAGEPMAGEPALAEFEGGNVAGAMEAEVAAGGTEAGEAEVSESGADHGEHEAHEDEHEAHEEQQAARPRQAGKRNAKGRRSSVPSWDEIMLGSSRQRD